MESQSYLLAVFKELQVLVPVLQRHLLPEVSVVALCELVHVLELG